MKCEKMYSLPLMWEKVFCVTVVYQISLTWEWWRWDADMVKGFELLWSVSRFVVCPEVWEKVFCVMVICQIHSHVRDLIYTMTLNKYSLRGGGGGGERRGNRIGERGSTFKLYGQYCKMLVEQWTYNSSNESYKKTTYLLQDSKHWKYEIILSKVLLMKKLNCL